LCKKKEEKGQKIRKRSIEEENRERERVRKIKKGKEREIK
jgi:hypothetical protein